MCRKIRTIGILLLVLSLIYVQQGQISYAMESAEEQKKEEVNEEGENDDPKDDSDDAPELPIEVYEMSISKVDGKNGYYLHSPSVTIKHKSKRGTTHYQLQSTGNIVAEGTLETLDQTAEIPKEVYGEGANILTLWMEDEEGLAVENMNQVHEILLDTTPPTIQLEAENGFDTWYKKEAWVFSQAADGEVGSGIENMVCYSGNQMVGQVKAGTGEFLINQASNGGKGTAVTITASDVAGNKSEITRTIYIDTQAPTAQIQGVQDYMITSQPVEVKYLVTEDNKLNALEAQVEWENVDGTKQILNAPDWSGDDFKKETNQVLQEDGLYRISLSAQDHAGYASGQQVQVMIDTHNPVIKYVDELDGTYMQKFQWMYNQADFIQDYTTYVYQIWLDEKMYALGQEVTEEGGHALRIKAIDSAGNVAESRATFVVDHTPPQVQFLDVEENASYEETKSFRIATAKNEDTIRQVTINGQKQKVSSNKKVYEYTVNEVKDYEVSVTAVDLAGNETTQRMTFEVKPKATLAERIVAPIQKALAGTEEQEPVEKTEEHKSNNFAWIVVVVVLVIGGGVGGYIYRKRS